MPVYSVTSPESGRTYQVNIDRDPTPEDVDSIWPQLDAHAAQQEANKPFFSLGDTLSGIGTALGGLPETATASYYRLTEGMKRPDQYSPEARAAFDAEQKFTQQVQQESQNRLMRGEASSTGESFRDAAPSLGFSGVTMGANILGRVVGRPAGAVVGGLVSAPSGPGAVGGAGIGGAIGETTAGMAASGYAAYRMAGNQFLDQAFQRIGEERAKRGEPWGEQEKAQAYNELLPLAQNTGLWEAGPEAVGNAVGLAAGKYVLGLGKKAATDLAETIWKKAGKKVAALAGGTLSELGTETITQVGGAPAQAQAEALALGNPNWQQEQGPYAGPGGTLKALADVAPATLAQSALMLGAGGAVKAGQTLIDQRRNQGAGQPLSEAPASAPDAVPESTGDLTAADVADLDPQPMPRREPILAGVPDRMARVRENALNTEPVMEGDVITDLRVPQSPAAIAESQRIEKDRAAKEAEIRMLDARARGMPMVADSPTGSRDIVDWANENPIYLPPGFSADRKNAEYDALQRNPLPPYWRQFVASSKQGGNPDSIAQRAFDAGLIAEPTPDAYLQALQEGIAGRQQYRVQFAQRDKALAQEEKRVIDFEKSQTKLAKKKDTQQVPFEDIVPGDEMTIDGEPAVVRNVEYNEDGYLTNVVIEDGKRFGLMQFDPQTRGGLLVDEFKPASQPFAPAATQDQPQTITGSNEQTGSEMPVPPPTAAAGAGAGGVTRSSSTATPRATAARTAPPASVGGGQGVASGGGAGASETVAPAAGEVNLEDVNAKLQLAGGFTNLDVSGRTAGFLNTEILSEARQLIADGFTTFANWSQAMVTRFGRGIKAHLERIWQQVKPMAAEMLMNYMRRTGSLKDLFAGEKAIIPPFMRDSLDTAKAMAAAGKEAETIRAVTGWFPGKYDGKMRWEIPDEGAKWNSNLDWITEGQTSKGKTFYGAFSNLRGNDFTIESLPLEAFLSHDALYAAYPEARSIQIRSLNLKPAKASWGSAGLVIDNDAKPAEALSSLLHELQHWIQDKEGFGRGSNPSMFPKDILTQKADLINKNANDQIAAIQASAEYQTRRKQLLAQVAPVYSERLGRSYIPEFNVTTQLSDEFGLDAIEAKRREQVQRVLRAEAGDDTFLTPQNVTAYRRTAGEIEARDVQARQGLTAEQRQATAPYSSENIAPEDAIVLMDAAGPQMSMDVPEGQDVTRSRFASPDEAENLYDIQATETMRAESAAWLEANGIEAALAAMEANSPPQGLRIDHLPSLGAQVITRLAKLAETGTEAQRLQADALLDRAGRAWHGKASQEAGRTLQQRAMATDELRGIAPILATKQVLVERADRVVKERFEGGAKGAVQQVKDIDTKASAQAGEELAADLEAETAAKPNKGGNAIPPSKRAKPAANSGRITAKHPNLKKLLDALRKKVAPGMTWAEIFMTLPAEQKARQREIYRRLMLDERLKALNQGERLQLTNELDRSWQRERRKVFVRELEKITGLGKTSKDRDKVKAALPRLLRLMNLGMLNSETFRGAIAQEYGIQQIDAATGAELRKLGEQIQQAPEGLPRRKLEQQLMQRLQNLTGSTMAEVLESWWTASVLSGWRTQMDIALSLANGLEDVTLGSLVTALRTGNGRVAKDALFAMLSNLPTAMNEALDHLLTGNRAAMRSYDAEVKAALEDGNKLFGNVGRQLLNKGGMAKLPGAFMEFVSRMMTALDHINSTSTYEGAKAMALARHPELYEKALTISPQDRQAARTQARLELTGGEAPTTRQQRVEENARMKEILDQRVPLEFQAQAREIGLESALQGEPTGLGSWIYRASNALNNVHRQSLSEYEKNRPDNLAGRAVLRALRITSPLVKVLTGTKFVRTVGHSINRSLSYAPGVGLIRFAEKGMQGSPAKADILLAKQLFGTAVGLALLMAFRDGEDDEQGIEGSWRGLTPQQKGQLLAEGKQPYSIWTRDAQGRIRTWNYQNWGIAGVLGTIGGMEDQRRYNSQGKDDLAILIDGILSGGFAWMGKAQLTGLQILTGSDQPGSSSNPAQSWAGTLNRYASTTVGGVVPRLFKDVDMVISPQLRDTSEWWMKWAAQMPMLRETSSGKRVNIFGEDIVLDRTPTSRITQVGTLDPALRTLGRLNERDIWLPDPTQGVRTVKLADGTRRKMTTVEKDRYQRATGAAYRKFITEQGAALLRMDAELARETISKVTERLRKQAAYDAVRR